MICRHVSKHWQALMYTVSHLVHPHASAAVSIAINTHEHELGICVLYHSHTTALHFARPEATNQNHAFQRLGIYACSNYRCCWMFFHVKKSKRKMGNWFSDLAFIAQTMCLKWKPLGQLPMVVLFSDRLHVCDLIFSGANEMEQNLLWKPLPWRCASVGFVGSTKYPSHSLWVTLLTCLNYVYYKKNSIQC